MAQENVQEQEVKAKNTISLDDDDVVVSTTPLLKMAKDQKVRIAIPAIDNIAMYSQHFAEDAGFIRCLADKGEPCPACKMVDDPVKRFKINILVYNTTTSDGTPPEDLNYVSMTHNILRIGIKEFGIIRSKHKKVIKKGGLGMIDLILTCTNDQFQHHDYEDCEECLWREDERLGKMAKSIIDNKFIDFENSRDRDFKYPTPVQLKKWLEKATGQKVETKDGKQQAKSDADAKAEAEKLLEEVSNSQETPQGNIKGLI